MRNLNENTCPNCGNEGNKVELKTIKSLLRISLLNIKGKQYYFCPEANCDVVYFDNLAGQNFLENELREKVYQKHANENDSLVCYCFGYTLENIKSEFINTESSKIYDVITEGTKNGYCACDIRNPQGSCCLSNVKKILSEKLSN